MTREYDVHLHLGGAAHNGVEVFDFEPQQDTVSVGPVARVANGAVRVVRFKAVQLRDDLTIPEQLLIDGAAVPALAAKKTLVPAAAGFDIGYRQERLWSHRVTA
jgi:hypothetical protein